MQESMYNDNESRYTLRWFGNKLLILFAIDVILSLVSTIITTIGRARVHAGLLLEARYETFSESVSYCFGIILVTSLTLMLLEIAYRRSINLLQYGLISIALTLFFLILLAVAEQAPFGLSFLIAAIMIVGLIGVFIHAVIASKRATYIITSILSLEYLLMFILISFSSMALLVGSLALFILIAAGMYFTVKLKIEDDQLVIK